MEVVWPRIVLIAAATSCIISICVGILIRGPVNTTACIGSTAEFRCSASAVVNVFYLVDGMTLASLSSREISASSPISEGDVITVKLLIPANVNNNNSQVLCRLVLSNGQILDVAPPAVLVIQDDMPPPELISVKLMNSTTAKLEWSHYSGLNMSLLSYTVEVRNSSGLEFIRATTKEPQLIIGELEILCNYYEATVASNCGSRLGNRSVAVPLGLPPFALLNKDIELIFPMSPAENITLNISIFQQRVCAYTITAFDEDTRNPISISLKPLFKDSNISIGVTLPANKHFVLIIMAINGYGVTLSNFTIGTFDVKDIVLNSESDFVCIFNTRSLAKGCLVQFLYETTGAKYCQVQGRLVNGPLNQSYCKDNLSDQGINGSFTIKVYDIESDGTLSPIPALTRSPVILHGWARSSLYSVQWKESASTIVLLPSSEVHISEESISNHFTTIIIAISTFSSLIMVLVMTSVCAILIIKKHKRSTKNNLWILKRRRNGLNKQSTLRRYVAQSSGTCDDLSCDHHKSPRNVLELSTKNFKQYVTMFEDVLISYNQLQINDKPIGEGAFGIVYKAELTHSDRKEVVAVKSIKDLHSKSDMSSFFDESARMKSFHHPNIVGLLGMCLDSPENIPLMVLPYMAKGNLKKYLQSCRRFSHNLDSCPEELSNEALLSMCLDIARGMRYLADRRFIHRDLAARNCMVDDNLTIKVGDFGLSRDAYETNYYKMSKSQQCPVKWMPPEMLRDGISTEKSDIWAYGITCWEVFSLGSSPYPGVENHEMLEYLNQGFRLKQPSLCPDGMYRLMQRCWNEDPMHRPCFREIVDSLA